MACDALFLCKLTEDSILTSCLVASLVTPATSGYLVYSPDGPSSFSSPISFASATFVDAGCQPAAFPCSWKHQMLYLKSTQLHLMKKFQLKLDLKVLWCFAKGKSRSFAKKLLSQIFSMIIFYFKSKKQSILFMLLLAASPSSAPSSQLQPFPFILVTTCMG